MTVLDTEATFQQLVEPLRGELTAHCYRMLGSVHDAEDLVQETYLRAWRAFHGFEQRSSVRTWMYRIATNACLTALESRGRRPMPTGLGQPASDPNGALDYRPEVTWLEPLPDSVVWGGREHDPADDVVTRESVRLAFVAALQHLTPLQRAVLILRDVLAWQASEVAKALDISVAAVNSALQRARARIAREHELGTLTRLHAPSDAATEATVMSEFLDAWAAVDVPRIVALLTDDALLTMPPMALRFQGAAAVGEFLATQPAQGRLDRIRHTATRANGQPTLASYADEHETGTHVAYGVMVFALSGNRIAGITGFPHDLETFAALGLPRSY
jgi:RNA polymerase sigma-70 factor, ECF subfamily